MNTSIIYIDTQSSSYVTSEEHIRLLSSYGILKMIYKDLKVDDGEESLVKMIDTECYRIGGDEGKCIDSWYINI